MKISLLLDLNITMSPTLPIKYSLGIILNSNISTESLKYKLNSERLPSYLETLEKDTTQGTQGLS